MKALLCVLAFVAGVYGLLAWLRNLALRDSISNPFEDDE